MGPDFKKYHTYMYAHMRVSPHRHTIYHNKGSENTIKELFTVKYQIRLYCYGSF